LQVVEEKGIWTPRFDIVAARALEAKDELRSRVASTSGEFTIDLSEVRIIDSRGLGILISVLKSLEAAGRSLRLRGANEDLIDVFRLIRLDRHVLLEREER